MYWFTADEHYGHANIIKYTRRPFSSVEEMDEELIRRHNQKVAPHDVVVHVGDFCFTDPQPYIERLNGTHIFVKGDHDNQKLGRQYLWMKKIGGKYFVVACHWPLRVWPRKHYGALHVHGHSHGRLDPLPGSWDVGVDNNNFYPVSLLEAVTLCGGSHEED